MFETKQKVKKRLLDSFGKVKKDSFDFDSIEKYFRNKKHKDVFQVISDKTSNDLDINELYMFVDRTTSRVDSNFSTTPFVQFPWMQIQTLALQSASKISFVLFVSFISTIFAE